VGVLRPIARALFHKRGFADSWFIRVFRTPLEQRIRPIRHGFAYSPARNNVRRIGCFRSFSDGYAIPRTVIPERRVFHLGEFRRIEHDTAHPRFDGALRVLAVVDRFGHLGFHRAFPLQLELNGLTFYQNAQPVGSR